MKYPVTPDYIKSAPNTIAAYYRNLEAWILQDICGRFKLSGDTTATALEHIRNLQRRGYSYSYIKRYIKTTLKLTDAQYRKIMQKAIADNQKYYSGILHEKRLVEGVFNSQAMKQEIDAIITTSRGMLDNLTRTMGFSVNVNGVRTFLPMAQAYQQVLSEAEVKVWSGAQSYSEAIREAVRQLAQSGLHCVTYTNDGGTRVDQMDVAVRRSIMTAVAQVADAYSAAIAEEVPTEYWEITAHIGARDKDVKGRPWANHKKWQGKVYSTVSGDKYPNIYDVCGLGKVDGLAGINCRHVRYPFWDGISERTYTDEELANIDPPPFEFNGVTYNAYAATQKQRAIERDIRRTKRELLAYDAAGDTEAYTLAAINYRRYNDLYRQFSKAAGLKLQHDRTFVEEFRGDDDTKAEKNVDGYYSSLSEKGKGDITQITDEAIESVPAVRIPGFTEECEELQKINAQLLRDARDKNNCNETAIVVSRDFGRTKEITGTETDIEIDTRGFGSGVYVAHNHPRNSSFSAVDIRCFIDDENLNTLVIVKNNGGVESLTKLDAYGTINPKQSFSRIAKKVVKTGTEYEWDKAVELFIEKMKKEGAVTWQKVRGL